MSLKITKDFKGVVFSPRKEEVYEGGGVLYPRVIELHHAGDMNGTLLATFDYSTLKEPPVSPIFKSVDGGKTWEHYSDMADTKNGWGIRFQPVLFELPKQCGDLPAGTIVFSGNSVPLQAFAPDNPPDFIGTELQFYISRDHGKTWEYRSSYAYGGVPIERNWNALGPVWEPFIYINAYGDITIVFTDERPHSDERYDQTLAVISSKDGGKTWGEEKLVVAIPDRWKIWKDENGNPINAGHRPGMAIVTRLPNGKYFMCYEIVAEPDCDVYFKISDDGMDFGDPASWGTRPQTKDGKFVGSMPYCVWTKNGGENGTIILSGKRDGGWLGLRDPGNFLVNYNLGEGPWEQVPMLVSYDSRIHQAGWSMGMACIENDTKLIQLAPTQMNPVLLQISYGIGVLSDEEK